MTEILQMTDLFAKVPGVPSSKGVAMTPPPASILSDVNRMVTEAMATIPADKKGALVGIATLAPDGGVHVNMALATKVGSKVSVISWVGRSWGKPIEGGAAVQVSF